MKKLFQDYFMQEFYEDLRNKGVSKKKAIKETVDRFNEYDQ